MTNSPTLSNEQIVLVALWWLRADAELADIEDVAVAADEIAEKRFRWRKYPEQINIQAVGKALRDAKQHGLATGTSARGWMLTEQGLSIASVLAAAVSQTPVRRALTAQEKVWRQKERTRLLGEDAYKKLKNGSADAVLPREVLRFFRLDEYITGETRRARVARISHSFADDPELGPAVKALAERVPQ